METQAPAPLYVDASTSPFPRIASPIAIDTEGSVERAWGLSFSCFPGEAYVLRADAPNIPELGARLQRFGPRAITAHNLLHDFRMFRALGLNIQWEQCTDTMLMAYLLGYEFVGLKKLAGLLLGKDRDSYSDVMEDANERIGRAWLQHVATDVFPRWPGAKPPELEKKLRLIDRMIAKYDKERPFHVPGIQPVSIRKRWADCTAREFFEDEMALLEPMPEATLDDISAEDAVLYAAEDADDTGRIRPLLERRIDELGLRDVLEADLAILPILDRMQTVGISADPQYFGDLSAMFELEMTNIGGEIERVAGRPINPRSGDQVAHWLFEDLGLKNHKRTDSGRPTTDDKTLQALLKNPRTSAEGKRAIELICDYREVSKLKTSYADLIPGFINPRTGRLHPRFKNTATDTGRLAAEKPNLLAFPKHGWRQILIRKGFYASPGRLLGEWDLDQIEMRVMAIDALDERMIEEFLSGVDKHTMTASLIFGKRPEDVDKEVERFAAKAVNFGILMGITEFGLLDQFKKQGSHRGVQRVYNRITEQWEERRVEWTEDDCRQLLREWHRAYPQASAYIYGKHAEARRYGYVRDMWGRLRHLPDITCDNPYFRAEAERQAQATPIQSGAQGIVKRWMAAVWARLSHMQRDIYVEPLLQIHDALILEFDADHYDAVNAMMLEALSELQMFPIPITCKGKTGERWSDL